MGVTLTDVLLFGKAQSDDVDNATLVIYRRNILRWSALGGYLDIIVKGVAPLSLPDAIANSLQYVKAFGGTEQRNLPQPYTQVNYVTNTAPTAVNTGIMIDFAKNYEFEVECRAVRGSWYILQSRAISTGNITGISGSSSGNTITLVVGNVTACISAITRTVGHKLYVKATLNNGTATLYVKDETANTEDTQTGSYGTSQPNPTVAVYLLGNAGYQYVDVNSDIYMARIKENDTVVMDYVPARQSATAGFYDTVSGTFKQALTPANLTADGNTVPTPDTPMDIVCNNGVLKVSPNLYNMVSNPIEQGTLAQGFPSSSDYRVRTSDFINIVTGNTYTVSTNVAYIYVWGFSSDNTPTSISGNWTTGSGYTFTAPSNVVKLKLVFAKSTDNTQTIVPSDVSWVMLEQGSPATPYMPYGQIYTDGTVETINVHGKNLFDSANNKAFVSEGQTVTISFTNPGSWTTVATDTGVVVMTRSSGQTGYQSETAVIPAGASYLTVVQGYGSVSEVQIEKGSTATTYQPYFDGGTATAEMLLKVGDYQDVQSILDGVVTRKVGIKVLDGTETWSYSASYSRFVTNIPDMPITISRSLPFISTHYQGTQAATTAPGYIYNSSNRQIMITDAHTTVEDWTQWLADQYAASHPVIVLYPLDEPTTESVAGQTLQVQAGDNTLEITQASMTGLELEAEYQAAVSLTIQEVQDANLDPNVEVTIN